jgi:Zinc-binding dehydrogenase
MSYRRVESSRSSRVSPPHHGLAAMCPQMRCTRHTRSGSTPITTLTTSPLCSPSFGLRSPISSAMSARVCLYALSFYRRPSLSGTERRASSTSLSTFGKLFRFWVFNGYALAASLKRFKRGLDYIVDKLQLGKIKVVIAKTFPLKRYADAHRYLESNGQIGRLVVTVLIMEFQLERTEHEQSTRQ